MDNWQIDNYKISNIYKFFIVIGSTVVVAMALYHLSTGMLSTTKILLFGLPLIFIMFQGIFSKLEAIRIASKNGDLYINKRNLWRPRNRMELYIKKEDLTGIQFIKPASVYSSKIIINYKDKIGTKEVAFHLKNFSSDNRTKLIEKLQRINKI